MGSVDCIAWLCFLVVSERILGGCVLEDLIESTDHDTGDDWNLSIPIRVIPRLCGLDI